MITLIQTDCNERFNIALMDTPESKTEGYIEKLGDMWFPFSLDNEMVAAPAANPVDAAKSVVLDFAPRAAAMLDTQIALLTSEIASETKEWVLRVRNRRLADAVSARDALLA